MMPEVFNAAPLILGGVIFVVYAFYEAWVRILAWADKVLDRRAIVRMGRAYGIEYVPGEDLEAFRNKVIAKRDEVIR